MKLIKTASVAVLLFGMGLTSVESVRAQSREQITTIEFLHSSSISYES